MIDEQKQYLDTLDNLNKAKKPIFVSNYEYQEGTWKIGKWLPLSKTIPPIDYRTVLSNEIIIDIDAKIWSVTYELGNIVKTYLDNNSIPYYIAYTGGKGIHFHIFFSPIFYKDIEKLLLEAKKYGFSFRELRIALWKYLLKNAKIRNNFLGKGNIFDDAPINFDENTKGHLIRCIGGRKLRTIDILGNVSWQWKTCISEIPKTRPKSINPSDVDYPLKIDQWRVPLGVLRDILINFIDKNKSVAIKPHINVNYNGFYTQLPCVSNLINKGNEEGMRHDGAGIVSLACALDKLNNDETNKILTTYKNNCDSLGGATSFSVKELNSWVLWYKGKGKLFWDNNTCNIVKKFRAVDLEKCETCPLRNKLNKDVILFLSSKDLLDNLQKEFGKEVVDEKSNRMVLFLCYCSAYLNHRVHPKLSGQSSIGKSFIMNKILSFIPEEDVLEKLTSASAKYFNYALTQNPNIPKVEKDGELVPNLDGKILLIQEFEGAEDAIVSLRPLMSGDQEGINVGIVEKDNHNKNNQKNMVAVGVPVFASASTNYQLDKEFMTRVWEMELDNSEAQTKRIMMFEAEEDIMPGCHTSNKKEIIKDAIRLLKKRIKKVMNPFALLLAKKMPTSKEFVRLRRDFKKIKEFIKIVAWLNQYNRPIYKLNNEKYVLTTLEDYYYVKKLIQSSFKMIFSGSNEAREVYKICEKYQDMGDEINVSNIANEMSWGTDKTRRILNLLESKSFLLKKESEHGRGYIYKLRYKKDIEFPSITIDDLREHYNYLLKEKPNAAEPLKMIIDYTIKLKEEEKQRELEAKEKEEK